MSYRVATNARMLKICKKEDFAISEGFLLLKPEKNELLLYKDFQNSDDLIVRCST